MLKNTLMLKIQKAITDGGNPPIATGTSPLIGTTPIGHLTRRIRITRIRLCGITRTLGSMDITLRTMDITEATIRITGIIEATTLIQTSIGGITGEVGTSRSRDALTTIEGLGVVKTDVHGIHAV